MGVLYEKVGRRMSVTTDIAWCDSTVNPATGCDGCELWHRLNKGSCYAGRLHETRMAKSLPHLYAPDFTEVRLAPGRMAKAAAWPDLRGKKRPNKPWLDGLPRMIFVGDMGDVFSRDVPFDYIKREVMQAATSRAGRHHNWLLLTKQPRRLATFAEWWQRETRVTWPSNVWCGTSITSKATASRARDLVEVRAAVRFLSVEPLLEDVSDALDLNGIHWVIVGGESGPDARPCRIEWIRKIIDKCQDANVPVFAKQLGDNVVGTQRYGAKGGDWDRWPEDLRIRQVPGGGR